MDKDLQIINMGKKDFSNFYKVNHRLWLQRLANDITDSIIFVDHPHVVIVGDKGNKEAVTVPNAMARREEIPFCQVDWDGDITYRGPGQLIIYPVIHIQRRGLTIKEINHKMENVMINLFHQYGLQVHTFPNGGGIGVNGNKIADIDLEVRQMVTRFNIAININPRLSLLRMLQIESNQGEGITSIYSLIKKKVDIELLKTRFIVQFQEEFGYHIDKVSSF